MPVRILKKSYQNVTGLFFSTLLKRHVQFDSLLERDFILLLDMHPAVRWFTEQPMKIRYRDRDGIEQIYVPDFLIEFEDLRFLGRSVRQRWIVETKYRCDLKANWSKIRPKLRAGFCEARRRKAQFRIVTESCLSSVSLRNAKFLRPFLNVDLSAAVVAELIGTVRMAGRTTVGALLCCPPNIQLNEKFSYFIWASVAKRMVAADLEMPLGAETTIWVR